jgi:hypothetical protein
MTFYFKKLCCSALLLFTFAGTATAQKDNGLVSLQAQVPSIVQLSTFPIKKELKGAFDVQYKNNKEGIIVIKVSGFSSEIVNLPIRLQIRSNIPYDLNAVLNSQDFDSLKLNVLNAANTGRSTADDAIQKIIINPSLNKRFYFNKLSNKVSIPEIKVGNTEIVLLRGPKISLAGTLTSSDNAIEIELIAQIIPPSIKQNWIAEITFSAVPSLTDDYSTYPFES